MTTSDDSTFGVWRKSTFSDGGDNCVEVAMTTDGTVGVRHSKNPAGPVLSFTAAEWAAFTNGVRSNEFDA
jgi:hypothetical protein